MKKLLLAIVILLIYIVSATGCKKSSSSNPVSTDTVIDKKPNIYLYPKSKMQLTVKIKFPAGGSIIESIPEYKDSWTVTAEPSGKIDDKYNYLYYEAKHEDKYQYKEGWLVNSKDLLFFFKDNLSAYGFKDNEIKDFTDYWVPKLKKEKYYIYPQTAKIINQMVELNVSVKPESVLRLYYVIKEAGEQVEKLVPPKVTAVKRTGFTIAEWGVVEK